MDTSNSLEVAELCFSINSWTLFLYISTLPLKYVACANTDINTTKYNLNTPSGIIRQWLSHDSSATINSAGLKQFTSFKDS